jgi:hypothetical protein
VSQFALKLSPQRNLFDLSWNGERFRMKRISVLFNLAIEGQAARKEQFVHTHLEDIEKGVIRGKTHLAPILFYFGFEGRKFCPIQPSHFSRCKVAPSGI